MRELKKVGRSATKIDSLALATGQERFTADLAPREALVCKLLYSPHAHAEIANLEAEAAKAIPGVVEVFSYQNVPRVLHTTAGQGFPEPSPYDAVLFDRAREPEEAARAAAPLYQQAEELHAAGCTLPRRPRYYQLMGQAYLALRLAKTAGGYDALRLQDACKALDIADEEFPASAEIPYTRARAECALAQTTPEQLRSLPGPGSWTSDKALTQCALHFEEALQVSLRQDRPRFLRTHRSLEDWIVRSRSQSEFEPLRELSRYREMIEKASMSAPQRL